MIVIENECVDCDLPCIYEACRFYKVIRCICDNCEEEQDDLYWFDGQQLCLDCVKALLEKVEYDDLH